jgi:nucleoside-diphosphate-sugar epimerase
MVWGVNGVSSMATRAVVAGHDGSVVNNVYSAKRLALVGIVGSNVASELIQRGQDRVILDNAVRSSRQAQNQQPPSEVGT